MIDLGRGRLSRRQALRLLGAGVGSGLVTAATPAARLLAATRGGAGATAAELHDGARAVRMDQDAAIVRTIFADLAPEDPLQ